MEPTYFQFLPPQRTVCKFKAPPCAMTSAAVFKTRRRFHGVLNFTHRALWRQTQHSHVHRTPRKTQAHTYNTRANAHTHMYAPPKNTFTFYPKKDPIRTQQTRLPLHSTGPNKQVSRADIMLTPTASHEASLSLSLSLTQS